MQIDLLSHPAVLVGVLTTAMVTALSAPARSAPFAYVPNSGDGTVSVIDTATTTVVAIIPVAPGPGPVGVAVNASGTKVYLTHFYENLVSVIDTATNTVTATVSVDQQPYGIAVNRAGTRAYVANLCGPVPNCSFYPPPPGTVSVIDTASNTVIATIAVGQGAVGVAVNPVISRAYVSNRAEGTISVIDTDANTVVAVWRTFGEPVGIAVDREGTHVYVADIGGIVSFSPEDSQPPGYIGNPNSSILLYGIALSPVGPTAYVTDGQSHLLVVDLSTGAVSGFALAPLPSLGAWGVSVTPDGKYVYVANYGLNTVSVVDPTVEQGHGTPIPPTVAVGSHPFAFGQFIAPPSSCFGLSDGISCDDGNACTVADVCASGVCLGTPVSGTACDDVNPCTANDTCSDGMCVGSPSSGSFCFEGPDPCAIGRCASGVCARIDCDDGNVCTVDSCDKALGCRNVPVDCDDANPCTVDVCDSAFGCQEARVADGTACSDGNPCNGLETCVAGTCTGGPPFDCDDHDACTEDLGCDPVLGCQHMPVHCDGTDACTDASCDPALGCQYPLRAAAPTFLSIGCRINALIAEINASTTLGDFRRILLASLNRAQALIVKAESAGDTRHRRIYLKRIIRRMVSFQQRVNSLTGRKRISPVMRAELLGQSGPIISNVRVLLNCVTGGCTTTTTTTIPPETCCGSPIPTKLTFSSSVGSGTCGTVLNLDGGTFKNLACGNLYFGGGINSVPPATLPDMGTAITKVTQCANDRYLTLGAAAPGELGATSGTCTKAGCLLGPPLPIPNTASTPTSTCVVTSISADASGTADCTTGSSSITLPLQSEVFLTGDLDPIKPGIQPCPTCESGTCSRGPNGGMPCTPENSASLGPAYPTSHDCPPDPASDIGGLPLAFALSTGTVSWTAVPSGTQSRVFCGFCRDFDDTGAFEQPAVHCVENGTQLAACDDAVFESCEQSFRGAFGPAGGAAKTISETGASGGDLSDHVPHPSTLVSVFCIPPTFNATVDGAYDLPGPGAVSLPGQVQLD